MIVLENVSGCITCKYFQCFCVTFFGKPALTDLARLCFLTEKSVTWELCFNLVRKRTAERRHSVLCGYFSPVDKNTARCTFCGEKQHEWRLKTFNNNTYNNNTLFESVFWGRKRISKYRKYCYKLLQLSNLYSIALMPYVSCDTPLSVMIKKLLFLS